MSFPVTTQIEDLFRKYGIDPEKNRDLVRSLMCMVYDEKDATLQDTYNSVRKTLNWSTSDDTLHKA